MRDQSPRHYNVTRKVLRMTEDPYVEDDWHGKSTHLMLGDSCTRLGELADESVDLSVYSPPFDELYTYSNTHRDMGNCATRDEFLAHYRYVVEHVLRLTKPGRMTCVHVMDLSTTKGTHGVIGLTDFSGQVIKLHQDVGWTYVARITIRKSPQAAAQRTKSSGLAFAQLHRDSAMTRPVHPDYLLLFRKPGENVVKIKGDVDNDTWISWAEAIWDESKDTVVAETLAEAEAFWDYDWNGEEGRPPTREEFLDFVRSVVGAKPGTIRNPLVWDDIREGRTLNVRPARGEKDEKHLCALQLDLIERCVRLWSNPGELVLSPCGGIGSEPYAAVKLGREAVSCELKPSYWQTAVDNLKRLESEMARPTLFDMEDGADDE